jgi:hypothetical protein
MNECIRLAGQLHRALFGEAWHGPALQQVLEGVGAAQAAAHPIPSAHSIFELVKHLHAWIVVVDRAVRGGEYERIEGDRDWPPVFDESEAAWVDALAELEHCARSLEEAVRALPPDRLGDGDGSFYNMLHGTAEHLAYHAGQIRLLARLQ